MRASDRCIDHLAVDPAISNAHRARMTRLTLRLLPFSFASNRFKSRYTVFNQGDISPQMANDVLSGSRAVSSFHGGSPWETCTCAGCRQPAADCVLSSEHLPPDV